MRDDRQEGHRHHRGLGVGVLAGLGESTSTSRAPCFRSAADRRWPPPAIVRRKRRRHPSRRRPLPPRRPELQAEAGRRQAQRRADGGAELRCGDDRAERRGRDCRPRRAGLGGQRAKQGTKVAAATADAQGEWSAVLDKPLPGRGPRALVEDHLAGRHARAVLARMGARRSREGETGGAPPAKRPQPPAQPKPCRKPPRRPAPQRAAAARPQPEAARGRSTPVTRPGPRRRSQRPRRRPRSRTSCSGRSTTATPDGHRQRVDHRHERSGARPSRSIAITSRSLRCARVATACGAWWGEEARHRAT